MSRDMRLQPRYLPACIALLILLCAFPSPSLASDDPSPRVVYTRSFPGSDPAWFSVMVDHSGAAEYREDPKDENPMRFQLSEPEAAKLFELAAKLDYFKRKLESPAKVARMGDKTLHYEKGSESSETTFNFTEDLDGRAISDWFEMASETERDLIRLQRAVKYDKLGVNDALLRLEVSYDKKRLVAPDQFLQMLDRIVKNEAFMHLSRQRAAVIAERIRAPK